MTVRSRRRTSLPRPLTILILAVALPALLAGCAGDGADDADSDAAADTTAATAGSATTPADTQRVTVADAGLQTPESVLHDADADVYLVSNINGTPLDKDDNGFIARIRPDGSVATLRWIDGAAEDVTLHAPKGLALKGDTLFVADIDSVRAFHRETGAPLGARGVPGATFVNALAVGPDGTLYATDSGLNAEFTSSGTEAVYRFDGERAVPVAGGSEVAGPNGVAVDGDALIVVAFGGRDVWRIPARADTAGAAESAGADSAAVLATLPAGQLDGVVRLDDGALLVSSWETGSVYRIPAGGGAAEVVVDGVPSPADIGWDGRRRRVLIPIFTEDRLVFQPLR